MNLQMLYRDRCAADTDINEHLPTLYQLVIDLDAQQVIELGVRGGESTIAFLAALEQTGGRLWSCDKNGLRAPVAGVRDKIDHWEFVLGNDRNMLTRAPDTCDILFIDSGHGYGLTLWELHNYGARVRDGGVIALHDTRGQHGPPVMRAVDEYLEAHPTYQFTNDDHQGGLGQITVYNEVQ